jgi:AcrR family transcriptional regulator
MDRILESARHVLLTHGYAGFTTRRVAASAKMRPGNLAYHFPSKRELLRALIAKLVDDYSNRLAEFLAESGVSLGKEIQTLVGWLLNDAVADETVRTFRELWAMSLHDSVIRRAVDDFYDDVMRNVAELLQRQLPNVNPVASLEFVQLLAVLSEGMTVLYGTRKDRVVSHERIVALLHTVLAAVAPEFSDRMCG